MYNFCRWLIIFYVYCFLGWCFESAYVSLCEKRLVNRGFIKGPLLPIYGSGAVIMLFSTRNCTNIVSMYLVGALSATTLEFFTGMAMEKLFKIKYWDYSTHRFNFKGHICLSSTVAWGFFTLLLCEVIHPPVAHLIDSIPHTVLIIAAAAITVPVAADFITSFKTALNIRDWHVKFEEYKEFAAAELHSLGEKLNNIRAEEQSEFAAKMHERLSRLATRDKIRMLRRNPTPHNAHLAERLEALRKGK